MMLFTKHLIKIENVLAELAEIFGIGLILNPL